jgi:hypothetical protein
VLIIFIKYPQPGFVKTRLAKEIGKERAASLYRLFAETILARIKDKSFTRFIFYCPASKKKQIRAWLGPDLSNIYPQKGRDLGEKLTHAFEFTFKKGAKKVVAIGTDSPAIDKEVILRAFEELESRDCVIGPSSDGGYYLLGLSSFYREIFKNIMWSTDRVFRQTLNRLEELKLNFSSLEEHFDVDNIRDLIVLKDRLEKNENNYDLPNLKNAVSLSL